MRIGLKVFCVLLQLMAIMLPSVSLTEARAQESSLRVADASICLDVVDLQCQGKDNTFLSSLGKLYCLTRIVGAHQPTTIYHVWYWREKQRARVPLQVNSSNWRTYSSKIIQPHETGDWKVEVLGPHEKLLSVIHFRVVP